MNFSSHSHSPPCPPRALRCQQRFKCSPHCTTTKLPSCLCLSLYICGMGGLSEEVKHTRDTYTGASTTVELQCPSDVTGLERIILVAQGDLQRHLSALFARTINIECIYTKTGPRGAAASLDNPIHQERQVHLKCESKVICVATSSVTVTSPECERLLLEEKFALGQIFRHLRIYPGFALIDMGTRVVNSKRELRRTYVLETEGIRCEILEVFPDRDMFDLGEAWLKQDPREKLEKSFVAFDKSGK